MVSSSVNGLMTSSKETRLELDETAVSIGIQLPVVASASSPHCGRFGGKKSLSRKHFLIIDSRPPDAGRIGISQYSSSKLIWKADLFWALRLRRFVFGSLPLRRMSFLLAILDLLLERYLSWRKSRKTELTFSRAAFKSTSHHLPSVNFMKAPLLWGQAPFVMEIIVDTISLFLSLVALEYSHKNRPVVTFSRRFPIASRHRLPLPHITE